MKKFVFGLLFASFGLWFITQPVYSMKRDREEDGGFPPAKRQKIESPAHGLSICKLPNDILPEILKYCSYNPVSQVSKRFEEVARGCSILNLKSNIIDQTLASFPRIEVLNYNENITDVGLGYLTNLKRLVCNEQMTDAGLQKFNLIALDLEFSKNIKNITQFTNLQYLVCSLDTTDGDLQNLTSLTCLDLLPALKRIDISQFTKLQSLVCNEYTTDRDLQQLTNLTYLDLKAPLKRIDISQFTNLRHFVCSSYTTDEELRNLTNLTSLDLGMNRAIENSELLTYTYLTKLKLWNQHLGKGSVKTLTNLTSLELEYIAVPIEEISLLTNLTELRITQGSVDQLKLPNLTFLTLGLSVKKLQSALPGLINLSHIKADESVLFGYYNLRAVFESRGVKIQRNDD